MRRKGQIGLVLVVIIIAAVAIFVFSSGIKISSNKGIETSKMGKGVIIKNIEWQNKVTSGIPTVIRANVKNNGYFDAKNVFLKLEGLTNKWTVDDTPLTPDNPERTINLGTLSGSPDLNGQTSVGEWYVTPPDIHGVKEIEYIFGINLTYDYTTEYRAVINIVSKTSNEKGNIIDEKTSSGPISVEIKPVSEWRVVKDKVPFYINFTNVGNGYIISNEIHLVNLNGVSCKDTNIKFYLDKTSGKPTFGTTTCNIPVESQNGFIAEIVIDFDYTYSIKYENKIIVTSESLNK
jgi:hypothetical protein